MQLGALGFEVSSVQAWHDFLTGVIGLGDVGDGRYRMDAHDWRFEVSEGPADDLSYVQWELTPEEYDRTLARLREGNVPHITGQQGAHRRLELTDPAAIPVRLVDGHTQAPEPFASPVVRSGFVGDQLGLGHLVLSTRTKSESVRFYTELLGIRLSDHIVTEVYGYPVDISFFHVNARHHSLAFGGPQRKRLHHFMVEARSMDEVGLAYDRAIHAGCRIMQTLGRHPNDRMFSFYARTPSKFEFEFGWGGREVDADTWSPTTYDHISEWGHHPPQIVFGSKR